MIEKNIYKTYLSIIRNSLKTKMFRNFWVSDRGKEFDAMRDGELSCAFYVSGILTMLHLIQNIHGTVRSTEEDLQKTGWKKITKPRIGSVIVWEKQTFGDEEHTHIGFYMGNARAISNSAKFGYPIRHDWRFGGSRKIEVIYWKEIK